MDKAKIRLLCNEIEDIATEIKERTMKDSYYMAQTIIDKAHAIYAEITAPPKSNGDRIRQSINESPTIEPEVRHGRWLPYGRDTAYTKYYRCSLCGYEIAGYAERDNLIKYNYCANCGADMREGGADNG